MEKIIKHSLVLLIILVWFFPADVQAAEVTKVLKIGSINPLSGSLATWGKVCNEKTIGPLMQMINHKGGIKVAGERYKLEMITEDDKATAVGGRAAAEKLIFRDKVKFMAGNFLPASILAQAPLATEQKIVTIVGGSGVLIDPKFPYLFQTSPNHNQRLFALVSVTSKRYPGLKTIATLNPEDETGIQMQKVAPKVFDQFGLKPVYNERHPRGTKDYYPFLTKLLAEKPDAFLSMSGPGEFALMTKQIRELGFNGKVLYLSTVADFDSFMNVAGEKASQGILAWNDDFNAPSANDRMKEFQEYYTKVAGGSPDDMHLPACYFATLEVLVQALEKANSLDSDRVKNALETSEFDTMIGRCRFEGKETYGIARRLNGIVRICEIKGRKYVFVGEAILKEP